MALAHILHRHSKFTFDSFNNLLLCINSHFFVGQGGEGSPDGWELGTGEILPEAAGHLLPHFPGNFLPIKATHSLGESYAG